MGKELFFIGRTREKKQTGAPFLVSTANQPSKECL
jgi:hypothetical protein